MILIGNELTKRFDSEDLVRKVDIFRDIAVLTQASHGARNGSRGD